MIYSKHLEFESVNAQLMEVMFPVESRPIFAESAFVQTNMFEEVRSGRRLIRDYRAIVNSAKNEVLCVVSKDYNLITNAEALKYGELAFAELFKVKGDLTVFKVTSSRRNTICHIDLVHKDVNFEVAEQDTWYPFIRITNSYNRTYALSFELGFVRKLCSNGCIFSKEVIKIKYIHSKPFKTPSVVAVPDELEAAKKHFIQYMLELHKIFIPEEFVFPIVCKALDVKKPKLGAKDNFSIQREKNYAKLRNDVHELWLKYREKESGSAYTVFNIITDLVSFQEQYHNLSDYPLNPSSFYHKSSRWAENFAKISSNNEFDIADYLEN